MFPRLSPSHHSSVTSSETVASLTTLFRVVVPSLHYPITILFPSSRVPVSEMIGLSCVYFLSPLFKYRLMRTRTVRSVLTHGYYGLNEEPRVNFLLGG